MTRVILVVLALAVSACGMRSPITFRDPRPLAADRSFDAQALGPLLVFDYPAALIPGACPDPANPGLNPGCEVERFMIWDGAMWYDAGMIACTDPTCGPEAFEFRLQDTYDPAATQAMACNDIGTVPDAWDREDGCSMFAGRLMEIGPPLNPRFVP